MLQRHLVILTSLTLAIGGGAKKLWANEPADVQNIIMSSYPVGNGKLGALPLGTVGTETVILNEKSLWAGGPFEDSERYIGGNTPEPVYTALPGIRETIWQTQITDESALYGDPDYYFYGNYETLANLTVSIVGVTDYTSYQRSLDLETGLHETVFSVEDGTNYTITNFCTFPDQVCVYRVESTSPLPDIVAGLQDDLRTTPQSNVSCEVNGVHLRGQTQSTVGMVFDARVQVLADDVQQDPASVPSCICSKKILVPKSVSRKSVTFVWTAGTNYNQKNGNSAAGYSFKGADPSAAVLSTIQATGDVSYQELRNRHIEDHDALFGTFQLELPDTRESAETPTAQLVAEYTVDEGNPFLESLLFDYGRYLFIASSRAGSMPPNLAGMWTESLAPAWSADYHLDINLQMNHWHTEATGLGGIQEPLWDFIIDTWVPRGTETAQLLYDAPGFVLFSNTNPFGFTGQMNDAGWSDYPASAAWMMKHVWDRYDYGRNVSWYQTVGYPLLKQVAEFWVHELVLDQYFNDGTLVAAPCNSPEHGWTTFACAHYQQVIWEVFDHVITGWDSSGDKNTTFLQSVKDTQDKMDKGIHIGWFGQLQEWKIGWDNPDDQHRHLSHLAGWYPGYSVGQYAGNKTITDAVNVSLVARGNGTEDSNTGWAKVWRVACWAQLNETDTAYTYLKNAVDINYAENGFSIFASCCEPYQPTGPFQIDANFGLAGAVLAMLVTDLPTPSASPNSGRTVLLGPAIPSAWGSGSVKGFRLRGGGSVDFAWDNTGLVTEATLQPGLGDVTVVNKAGTVLAHSAGGI